MTAQNFFVSLAAVAVASMIAKFVIELVFAFERDVDEEEEFLLSTLYGKRKDGEP